MSNASLVSSFGIDATGLNPANFDYRLNAKDKKSLFDISIFSLGGGYGTDTTIGFYNNYLSYLSINRETFTDLFTDLPAVLKFRQEVLPGSKQQVNYDFELKWFSMNYVNPKLGAFNLTMSDKVGLNTNVNSRDDYLPLTFLVTFYPDSSYDLTNVKLNQSEAIAWWIRKYSLGYAKQFHLAKGDFINSISFGFSAGLVHGFGNVITYNSKLDVNTYGIKKNITTGLTHVDSIRGYQDFSSLAALTDFFRDYNDGAQSQFDFFPKPAGKGYSLDFGTTIQFSEKWKLAFSVTDIGKITWDYNTFVNYDKENFFYQNFTLNASDPTYNQFVNDLEGLDSRDTTSSYETDMPTKYRAGLMFQPSEKLLIELNWMKGINNLPGNSDANIFSLGSEFFPSPFIPIRAGVSVGGPGDYFISLGMGLKLKYFSLDIATQGINQLIANKRFSVSFSGKLTL